VPGIRFRRLVSHFIDTLERYSATVIRFTPVSDERPAKMRVIAPGQATDCILFLWTITRGGGGAGVRPANERRIQMTNVHRMPLEPGIRTLLGGWSEEFGVYAFWDARRHVQFSRKSPSLQVDANTLETAGSVGIATFRRPTREGEEVVVAVSESALLWYVQNGLAIHDYPNDAAHVVDLADATPEEEREFLDSAGGELETTQRYNLVQTMRAYRDAKFRPAVLHAYSYRCAVCDTDLKLVDAAHIVPVSDPRSTDEVTNGLALCRLHHGAYDNALLGVQSDHKIVVNPDAARRLRELDLDSALGEFSERLPERIRVPASIEARPAPENLRLALQARRWPAAFVT